MPQPAISVIMSVYNSERFLGTAIESVLAQSFADFEFLIIDDGSSDRSPAIIHDFAQNDQRIRPILRENRGLIASLNEMLASAHAQLIARMDSDDICQPERFAKQVAFLNANPAYGVVGTWSTDIDPEGKPLPPIAPDHPIHHAAMLEAIQAGAQLLCHPSVMFRKDVVLQAGGYHKAFRHCEDLDLWLRLSSITHMGNIPEPLLLYRRYPEQVSSRHATAQQIGTAITRLAWHERQAGRPDPTEHWDELPPLEALDTLFSRKGVTDSVRETVAMKLKWSLPALRGDGMPIILNHLKQGGSKEGMWRTVLRLLRFGEIALAARLAKTLLQSRTHVGS